METQTKQITRVFLNLLIKVPGNVGRKKAYVTVIALAVY